MGRVSRSWCFLDCAVLIAARAQAAPLLQPPPSHLGKNWGLQELPSVLCAFFYIKPHKKGTLSPVQCFQALCLPLQGWFGAGFLCPRSAGQGLSPRGGLLVLQEHNVSSFLCSPPGDLTIKLSGQGVEAWSCFSHVSCLSFPCWPLFGSALEHLGGIRRARHLLLVPTRGSRPFTPVAQGAAWSKCNSRRGSVPSPAANAAHRVQP